MGGVSLLSALSALLALAEFLLVAARHHALVVRLEELGSLVERLFPLALLSLLLVHDLLENLPLPRLILAFLPNLTNILQLILLFLAINKRLLLVLVFLTHIVVVLVERLSVEFVSTIVLLEELLFGVAVHVLDHFQLSL